MSDGNRKWACKNRHSFLNEFAPDHVNRGPEANRPFANLAGNVCG